MVSTFGTYFPSGLTFLTFNYTSPLLWALGAARRVEIIQHVGTLVQNHAAMLWSLQHIRIMGIDTQWQKKQLHHNWRGAIFPMQIGAFLKRQTKNTVMGGWGVTLNKTRLRDRPAICIWPDRGERQLCVWCHSSESHQSRTGPNTSESRTHNCLPLKKHRWDFKNRASLSLERRKLSWDV